MSVRDAVIVSTARTPIGRAYKGAFNATPGATLGALSLAPAIERAGIDAGEIDDVVWGCVLTQGVQAGNIGRQVALRAGCPVTVSAQTIDRLPEILAEAVTAIKSCKLVRCVAVNFGPSAIECELVYDDRTRDGDTLADHKSHIIIAAMRIFAREKIQFAYPTQTTFTAAPDGTLVMPWAPPAETK